jgi:hypothetical protein
MPWDFVMGMTAIYARPSEEKVGKEKKHLKKITGDLWSDE